MFVKYPWKSTLAFFHFFTKWKSDLNHGKGVTLHDYFAFWCITFLHVKKENFDFSFLKCVETIAHEGPRGSESFSVRKLLPMRGRGGQNHSPTTMQTKKKKTPKFQCNVVEFHFHGSVKKKKKQFRCYTK